ncbi:MAG: hypothetical protein LBS54_03680, partial [Dysgonamonadaceae bacterium]|nr:hypothetical protein [Dysgonamonadaceae bacterium]
SATVRNFPFHRKYSLQMIPYITILEINIVQGTIFNGNMKQLRVSLPEINKERGLPFSGQP